MKVPFRWAKVLFRRAKVLTKSCNDYVSMLVRNFTPTDLGEIMRMVAGTFMQDYSPSMYLSLHSYWPEGFIVISEGGRMVGFVLGSVSGPEEARILIMVVKRERRDRGIGTTLLNEFMARCGIKGIKKVVLEVRASNKRASDFYSRHGFQYSGQLHKYYLDGEDGVKLVKWV